MLIQPVIHNGRADISLRNCDLPIAEPIRIERDRFSADFYIKDADMGTHDYPEHSLATYSYLGIYKNKPVISVSYNGGGSGSFGFVESLERSKDTLKVTHLYQDGDRANGGIKSAKIENGHLIILASTTAGDLYRSVRDNTAETQHTAQYLGDCPICMYGFQKSFDEVVVSYVLPDDFYYSRNKCLDGLITKYELQGKEIDKNRLKSLMDEYDLNCPKTPPLPKEVMGPHEPHDIMMKNLIRVLNNEKR